MSKRLAVWSGGVAAFLGLVVIGLIPVVEEFREASDRAQ
jgi:hypothetical protein